jgi:hypothetical protein
VFFVRQPEPAQHERDGRERLDLDTALTQGNLKLGQRDAGPARHKGADEIGGGLQHGTAVTTDLSRRRAAGLAHAPHQLDGRRRTDLETIRRLPRRVPRLDRAYNPAAQIQR